MAQLQPLIEQTPDQQTLALLGDVMAGLGHAADAAGIFEQAAALEGEGSRTCLERAAQLHYQSGNEDAAQLIGLRLLQSTPDEPWLVFMLANIFLKTGEDTLLEALAPRLAKSEEPEHLLFASRHLSDDKHPDLIPDLYRRLRQHFPDDPYIRMANLDYAREVADFARVTAEEASIRAELDAGNTALLHAQEPHFALMWLEDEAELRQAINLGPFAHFNEKRRRQRRLQDHRWGKIIRVGYVSADLWDDHATMRLLAEVLRQHDRERFEITLFCNTPERFAGFDRGARQTWGPIVSIRDMDDAEAEALIRRMGIDILVDLKGHTGHNRGSLFNRMAAPVQVAWLGFPGTSVGVDCDYIIGDRFVLPEGSEPHFHELFCRLPESYQPNDPVSRTRPPAASRASLGLPEDVFLFASFNAPKKITPRTLDLWSRVLTEAPQAHLWLMGPEEGLSDAFALRGITRERLHFARKMAYEPHIARVQAADLSLNTFPCNGHTTTSDMLWAGLPVVTARGQTFAGRVSESLLHAIGLPELVAPSYDGFVSLAAGLAKDRARLAPLRQRLDDNRFSAPLFDAERFCRHLESAYRRMADRARLGKAPAAFDVPALPNRIGRFG